MKERMHAECMIPEGAIGSLDGLFYKIGTHNFGYYWGGDEWRKSDKSARLIKDRLAKYKLKFSFDNRG